MWRSRQDLNLQPSVPETDALSVELLDHNLVARLGIEPSFSESESDVLPIDDRAELNIKAEFLPVQVD